MRLLHAISADEMVAVFLQTEVASTRFGPTILAILRHDGRDRQIIDQPDLSVAGDNAYRSHMLGAYRGYRRDADVFTGVPDDVRWYRALATRAELARVRYLNDDYWNELSGGSRLVLDAVANITRGVEPYGVSNRMFWRMANALVAGVSFPELIVVAENEHAPLVLLEGHARLTAYFLRPDDMSATLPVVVGYAKGMVK